MTLKADCSKINFYRGAREIGLLDVQPLSDQPDFKRELEERGQRFVALQGRHYRHYEGDKKGKGACPISLALNLNPVPPQSNPEPLQLHNGTLMNFQVV